MASLKRDAQYRRSLHLAQVIIVQSNAYQIVALCTEQAVPAAPCNTGWMALVPEERYCTHMRSIGTWLVMYKLLASPLTRERLGRTSAPPCCLILWFCFPTEETYQNKNCGDEREINYCLNNTGGQRVLYPIKCECNCIKVFFVIQQCERYSENVFIKRAKNEHLSPLLKTAPHLYVELYFVFISLP